MGGMFDSVLSKVVGAVATLAVLGIITGTWDHLLGYWILQDITSEHETEISAVEADLLKHDAVENEVLKTLMNQTRLMEEFRTYALTRTARAGICECGDDEQFILINSRGPAEMYGNFKRATITVRDITVTLPIEGVVAGSPIGPMILLSRAAARNLGMTAELGGVTIEPAGNGN